MTRPNLTLIRGGIDNEPTQHHIFVSAYVTDTRLMGVICVYIHWLMPDGIDNTDFHQFFYMDAEEDGFENYRSIIGNDLARISVIEQSLAGGLGGKQSDITEKEAAALIQEYAKFNQAHKLPMPQGYDEYEFLLKEDSFMTAKEARELSKKQCCPILSDYHAINYFLMRITGHDYKAAEYLMGCHFPIDLFKHLPAATLRRNVIEDYIPETTDTIHSYICNSLIESNNHYYLIVSHINVSDNKIVAFDRISQMRISEIEASFQLSKPEFITLYEILTSPETFDAGMMELSLNTMITAHESGKMYLVFNKHNDHVNNRIFDLSNDVYGLYFVTNTGQLLTAAYTLENIHSMEKDLRNSMLSSYLMTSSKYEFKEPVIYDFIRSDFEYFEDFLEFIQVDD